MRSPRWVGLVFSLLIVGVLGGLMAPLPSEASNTTLTLKVDNGTAVNILGSKVTCSATETGAGFNVCYAINTSAIATGSNSKTFKAGNLCPGGVISATCTAASAGIQRLLIADFLSADASKLTAVQFFSPTTQAWNAPNEEHFLRIVMTNKFDCIYGGVALPTSGSGACTLPTAGNYEIGLRSGGILRAGPNPATNTIQYDRVEYAGTGIFKPSVGSVVLQGVNEANTAFEFIQVDDASTSVTWTTALDQVSQFPLNACDAEDGTGKCKPVITQTFTVTLKGPDSVTLNDSNDMKFLGPCNLENSTPSGGPPGGNPAIPCHTSSKKQKSADDTITASFAAATQVDLAAAAAAGAAIGHQCVVDCPCADPNACKGTIVVVARVTPATDLSLPYFATGEGFNDYNTDPPTLPPPFSIRSDERNSSGNLLGTGRRSFNDLFTVGRGPFIITADQANFPAVPSGNGFWETDSIDCMSTLNRYADPLAIPPITEFIVSTWTVDGGSDKRSAYVNELGGGDTVTCTWHIHKNSSN